MRKICIALFASLTVLCMAFIFWQSAKTNVASSAASDPISDSIANAIRPETEADRIPSTGGLVGTRQNFLFKVSETVRTAAHVLEFAGLTFFAYLLSLSLGADKTKRLRLLACPCAALFGMLYALSDECHQYFVPGRSFQWKDVGFDSLGAALGVCVAFLAYWLFFRLRTKHSIKKHAPSK